MPANKAKTKLQISLGKFRETSLGSYIEDMGVMALMVRDSFHTLLRSPPTFSSITTEIYSTGVKSILIVIVAALAVGLVMAIQFGFGLARFGAKLYVPKIVTVSIVRELGPIFTALMLAARVGAGIASEVGSMKVSQQIDAIRALGTSPLQKIVLPKIIAVTFAAPLLTIIANFMGIFGGMFISSTQLGVSAYDYFYKAFEIITARDVVGGLFKAVVFGFIIGMVGCHSGLRTTGGTQGVGTATTRSVVMASVIIMFMDFVLTKGLWIFEMAFRRGSL